MLKLAEKENDTELLNEIKQEFRKIFDETNTLYFQTLMSGKADSKNTFLEINSGAGGTEAQDWVAMLLRMYLKWCENMKLKVEVIDQTEGEEAGFKSITLKITGNMSYGWLKRETGVHRLVRISPFDSNKRRHTSFSSVWVYPEIDKDIEIEINNKDLRIDTFRASGAGGQHINTTDSAVRITHLKYNIVVQSQSERSQHRNKDTAIKMLKSRIYEIEMDKKNQEKKIEESNKKQIGWGNQIRSYVLHPYKMVKDLRTSYQTSNADSVLDGEIFDFLESTLIDV